MICNILFINIYHSSPGLNREECMLVQEQKKLAMYTGQLSNKIRYVRRASSYLVVYNRASVSDMHCLRHSCMSPEFSRIEPKNLYGAQRFTPIRQYPNGKD